VALVVVLMSSVREGSGVAAHVDGALAGSVQLAAVSLLVTSHRLWGLGAGQATSMVAQHFTVTGGYMVAPVLLVMPSGLRYTAGFTHSTANDLLLRETLYATVVLVLLRYTSEVGIWIGVAKPCSDWGHTS
jgi:hypothetical protein